MASAYLNRRLSVLAVCGLVAAALTWQSACSEPAAAPNGRPDLPELRVTLGASRQDVVTIGLSEKDQKTFDRSGNFQEPHRLVMTLPDTRRFELVSRSTLVRLDGLHHDASRNEIVTTVYARRPLAPGRFQEAVADMLTTIRDMGVEPNADMIRLTTRGNLPDRSAHPARMLDSINAKAVELSKDGTRVHCTIKPDPEKGWYVLYIFSFSLERWPSTLRHRESERTRERAITSARPFLPAAVQIEEIFPSALHVFNNFVFQEPEDLYKTFITEAYFGQRYLLTMMADVELEPTKKTITRLRGEPTFVLKELESLARVPHSLGRLEPTWSREHRFGLESWNKVVAAHGDFSAIGIELDPRPVPDAEKYASQQHRNRQRVSLVRDMRERAIRSARPFLPAAIQIEEVFPATDHFFDNFVLSGKESDLRKTFSTEAYFDDRYQLTMAIDVELDANTKTIAAIHGEPTFTLRELESVAGFPERAEPTWRHEHRFDLQAWSKVYAAKGDFSVIDITIDKTPLSGNAAELADFYVRRQRSRRDRITLREEPATTESSARSDISQDSRED